MVNFILCVFYNGLKKDQMVDGPSLPLDSPVEKDWYQVFIFYSSHVDGGNWILLQRN